MTIRHISVLYFEGKYEAAKKRIFKLKAAGLIGERARRVNESSILFLTRKASQLLAREDHLLDYPPRNFSVWGNRFPVSDLTLWHELEVMDVKAAFHAAVAKENNLSISEFCTWPALYQFRTKRLGSMASEVLVKPDGFIRIRETQPRGVIEHRFFIEVDRSTETQQTLVDRAASYAAYYQSGGFAQRNGAKLSDFKALPFRVLFILKTAERRNNFAERLLSNKPPILTQAMLSTAEEVLANPLGTIWISPIDYRDFTGAMPSTREMQDGFTYRRDACPTIRTYPKTEF